jgi:hypothetical protein
MTVFSAVGAEFGTGESVFCSAVLSKAKPLSSSGFFPFFSMSSPFVLIKFAFLNLSDVKLLSIYDNDDSFSNLNLSAH